MTGVDLTQLDAIGPYSALRLLAEIGTDMSRWPTEKHFTSWLTLAPHNKISGGRLLSSKTQPSANRAAGILRMAAMSLGRTETALGAFYRRLAYRVGKAKAITATARKLAILVYRTLKDGLVYQDPGAAAYDAQHRTRVIRRLRQRAANLGFTLVDHETGEVLEGAVVRGPPPRRSPRLTVPVLPKAGEWTKVQWSCAIVGTRVGRGASERQSGVLRRQFKRVEVLMARRDATDDCGIPRAW